MKELIGKWLANIARERLAVFKPTVVAVTGSVGKTSTRTAIGIALSAAHSVRTPYKNYNNEFGVPLAILGEQSADKNAWEWLKLIRRARCSSLPPYLVLEYGADKPGDIKQLCGIAQPNIAVITAVSPVHVANYPSFERLVEEKASLGEGVPPGGLVVLNIDDPYVRGMRDKYPRRRVVFYGLSNEAHVRASDIRVLARADGSFDIGDTFAELRANVTVHGDTYELVLKNTVTDTAVSACLAALAVAFECKVPMRDAIRMLEAKLEPVNGRLKPLAGIKGSLILDDTYNAAPASVAAGLAALRSFEIKDEWDRRIAVLGDMAELGPVSEAEHRKVGELVAAQADVLVAVGPQMNFAVLAAKAKGMPEENVRWFANAVEAGRYLDSIVKQGDVVLVKGSQSMRMERAVKDIMAEPGRAAELLVRQEAAWL